jgi:O-acetyl-ADP-ribose deacetylase (regulator of RNase III)
MQMSRFFEDTVSARIRYCGASHDGAGDVVDDCIARELAGKMDGKLRVVPGTVISTGAGNLQNTHGVRAILHVAAVQGIPGVGYIAVPNIDTCVRNVLRSANSLALDPPPTSIVLPLLGTGTGQAGVEPTVRTIVSAIFDHFRSEQTSLTSVYLLAYKERELEALRTVLEGSGKVDPT